MLAFVPAACGGGDDDTDERAERAHSPEDDAETFSSLLENFEQGIADAKSDPSSLSGETPEALIEAQLQAQELGLVECAG